jgi:hypothetical protein
VLIDLSVYAAEYVLGNIDRHRYAPGSHIIYTQPHTTQNFINQKFKLTCNSYGTDELTEDGTQLQKHVGAAK